MSDTVTLYQRWDGYDYVTPVTYYHPRAEFRTVSWCTTHDSQRDQDYDDEYDEVFVCLQARAWRHHSPKNVCKFVNKLVQT